MFSSRYFPIKTRSIPLQTNRVYSNILKNVGMSARAAGIICGANGSEFFGVHLQARLRVALQKFARISKLIPACGSHFV
jgi:hypothetical protein